MTAPALPGAAPDPARLPPEVEATMAEAFRRAIEAGYDAAPDDKYFGAGNTEVAMDVLLASKPVAALRTAIRAALDKRGEVSAASSASARALGGDGEPVAWAVFKGDSYEWVHDDEAKARENERDGYRVVPLYTRPAATGDTGEVEKARAAFYEAAREAQEIAVDAASQMPLSGEEQAAVAEARKKRSDTYRALIKAERAATGGPDAR